MQRLPSILLVSICILACQNRAGWTAQEKQIGLFKCLKKMDGKLPDSLANKYCSCLLEKKMLKYHTYAEADTASPVEGIRMGLECISQLRPAWTAAHMQKGLNECLKEVIGKVADTNANPYCSCVLERMMIKYATFSAMDSLGTEEEGIQIGKECAAELLLAGTTSQINGPHYVWSFADQETFMNVCINNAVKGGASRQRAQDHCECTLRKIENKYASYQDADANISQEDLKKLESECDQGK